MSGVLSVPMPAVPMIPLPQGRAHGVREGLSLCIPQLGLGTYKVSDEDAERVVREGLELGYRHIDTAQMYGNEAGVGRALAASGIKRSELFITSKLNNPNHKPADVRRTFNETMDRLGLEELDLFLVHWPMARTQGISLVETWESMIELLDSGRVRAIGVSNYLPEHLTEIIDATGVTPAVNQVELHPYLQQRELRAFDAAHGILTQSWSPLARGLLLEDPAVLGIAQELGVSGAQVVIRWHLQHDLIVFPKSVSAQRMRTNADVFSFELSPAQMDALDALERGYHSGSTPDDVQLPPQ